MPAIEEVMFMAVGMPFSAAVVAEKEVVKSEMLCDRSVPESVVEADAVAPSTASVVEGKVVLSVVCPLQGMLPLP